MRKILMLLTIILISGTLTAMGQETETLFSDDVDHGGFGGLAFGATTVNGELAYLRGTRGAWVINFNNEHSIHLGLAGYRTHNNFSAVGWANPDLEAPDLDMSYGGFELEYVRRPSKLFHFSFQILAGAGDVEYAEDIFALDKTSDRYFALQPGANLVMNVTDWFRLSGGLFYRFTDGVQLDGTSDSDLSGVSTFVVLRFGWF